MRNLKLISVIYMLTASLIIAYVGWVVSFEIHLGKNQLMVGNSIVIATYNSENDRGERVLSVREVDGAANHWPRAWYRQAIANPNVEVKMAGEERF